MEKAQLVGVLKTFQGQNVPAEIPLWAQGTHFEKILRNQDRPGDDVAVRTVGDVLSTWDSVRFLDNAHALVGGIWTVVHLYTLARWLVKRTRAVGADQAVDDLFAWLQSDGTPAQEVLVIGGIETAEPFELAPGIQLIPFAHLPPTMQKDAIESPFRRLEYLDRLGLRDLAPWPSQEGPHSALIRRIRIKPKTVQKWGEGKLFTPGPPQLADVCLLLTLVGSTAPITIAQWYEMEDSVPFATPSIAGWYGGGHDVTGVMPIKFSAKDAQEGAGLCARFAALDGIVQDRLRVPLARLNQSRRRKDRVDRAIEIGIALESLFLRDSQAEDPISLPLRLAGAWYLGENAKEREELANLISAAYDCRSDAVHQGQLAGEVKVRGKGKVKTEDVLSEADALCAKALMKILETGRSPEWKRLAFGLDL